MFNTKFIVTVISAIILSLVSFGYSQAVSSSQDGTVQIEAYVPELTIEEAKKPSEFLSLSGIIKKFSVENQLHEYKNLVFYTEFQNTGEQNLKPQGYIILRNWFGKEIERLNFNHLGIVSLVGETTIYQNIWMPQNFLGTGKYTADLVMNYGNNENLTAQIHFWIFPWKVAGISIFSLLALLLLHKVLEVGLVGHKRVVWRATH